MYIFLKLRSMKVLLLLSFIICGTMAAPSDASTGLSEFLRGNRLFSADLYKQIIKDGEPGKFIMSPLSAEIVLALTNEGAFGETSEELRRGLSLPATKEATQQAVKGLLSNLRKSEKDLKLLTANKIYAAKNIKLNPSFNEIADNVYKAGIENVDFVKKEEAARTINQWVEEQTNNKIQDLILPSYIDRDTRLVLVNALYFSGKWINSFNKDATEPQKFYIANGDSTDVDMMRQTDFFNYYWNKELKSKFLELPYKGNNISLVIALPDDYDGISKLEENIGKLLEPQPLEPERVNLKLPKFKIETLFQLKPILQQLGVKQIFTNDAQLTGLIADENEKVLVDRVVQKAFIEVDEGGTEAAASTAVVNVIIQTSMVTYANDPVEFYADHPFVFYIKHNGVILFVGKYR